MRLSRFPALVPCLVLAACAPRPAAAQAPSPQPSKDACASPYFFVKSADAAADQLPLKSTSADVRIAGVIADVKVTQVYRNAGRTPLEAIYVFPGSTRAAVHGLTMTVGDRVVRAEIREKQKARADYDQAKARGQSAALLEQDRPNVFQMNVANILPGDEVKVELEYSELLVPTAGTYQFAYPTVVGPRYAGRPGTGSATGETWVANPYTHAGELPGTTFDLQVHLDAGMPIQKMACGTHKTSILYDGPDAAELRLDPTEAHGGNRDFILDYRLAGDAVQSGLILSRGKDENFFLLMAQPPARVAAQDMPPREYVFVMDVSGSQMGFPLDVSKTLMKAMLEGLRPQDRFNVMVFEGSSALFSEAGSVPATKENIAKGLDFVRQQNAGGGTELGRALMRALDLPRTADISRTFVVSTDGYISADRKIFDIIREHLGDANLFAFGIGSSVNRFLIEGMAHAGQGEPFMITNQAQAAAEAERFRAYVSSPALTHVRLKAGGLDIYDVEPPQLPDVLADRPVICFGKWRGAASGSLTVSGIGGRGPWQQSFDAAAVKPSASGEALRQLWARERVRTLADYNQFGQDDARAKEILDLGLKYSLLTDYTSFLAVDDRIRNAGGQQQRVTQPLPMPQGVSDPAVGGSSGAENSYVVDSLVSQDFSRGFQGAALAYMAPGVQSNSAACTVCVVGASSQIDETIAEAPSVSQGIEDLRVGPIESDRRDTPLSRVADLVEAKLKLLAKEGLLRGIPASFKVKLTINAAGAVTDADFDRPCGSGSAALKARILAWHFEAWSAAGDTRLGVPVHLVL